MGHPWWVPGPRYFLLVRIWYGQLTDDRSQLSNYTQLSGDAWWRHQMETFSALLALCAGNSPVTGEFPSQRSVTRSFDAFFDLRLYKRLRKIREAGDLRLHRAHYDFTVMEKFLRNSQNELL